MKNIIKKSILISAMTVLSAVTVSAMAAAPWSPKTQHQIHQYHKLGRKANHQRYAAAHALSNGNVAGAIRHSIRAEDLSVRRAQKGHQVHHGIHRWKRNHICHNGYYC